MYTHFGNQYTGETITTCNLRMNIHRRRKSGNEMSIDHYSNVSLNAIFPIWVTEKLPGNDYKNGIKDIDILKYQLQHENYWMKKLYTVLPYGVYECLNLWMKIVMNFWIKTNFFWPTPKFG